MTVINLAERRDRLKPVPAGYEYPTPAEVAERQQERRDRHPRRTAFWRAEREVQFWKALREVQGAAECLYTHHGMDIGAAYKDLDDGEMLFNLRQAEAMLLLTPVYGQQGARKKQQIINSGGFKFLDVLGPKLSAVLAADAAFLATPRAKRGRAWS